MWDAVLANMRLEIWLSNWDDEHPIIPRRSQSPRVSYNSPGNRFGNCPNYDAEIERLRLRLEILLRVPNNNPASDTTLSPLSHFLFPTWSSNSSFRRQKTWSKCLSFQNVDMKMKLNWRHSWLSAVGGRGPATTTRCYTHTSVCLHQHKTSNNIWQTSKVEEFIQIDKIRIRTRKWTLEKGSSSPSLF